MLTGRSSECARLEGCLEAARGGVSAVLVIRGEPGVGKTALLDHVRRRAHGMTVLTATGTDVDAQIAFSGLADVLRPILGHLDAVPERQAEALVGALALGPPSGGDRFTICAATLSLLVVAAERAPVAVLIDDAGRLDAPSAEALGFAARRLDAEPIVLVAAMRDDTGSAFLAAGLPDLILGGLDRAAARELLGPGVGDGPAERLYAATAGNPLGLLALRAALTEAQLSGGEPIVEPLPAAAIASAHLAEVERLSASAHRAALVAAAAGDGAPRDVVGRACAAAGVAEDGLEAALAANVIRGDAATVSFRHPLLREAVLAAAAPTALRAAHRAVAVALTSGIDAERRAWHMAAAAAAPDEAVAATLEQAAHSARARGGHAAAASAFERSARLTPTLPDRSRRLFEAGADRQLMGEFDRAVSLLDEALVLASDPLLRADVQLARSRSGMWQGAPMAAHDALVPEAERIADTDPGRAAAMLLEAAGAAIMAWEVAAAETTARRAVVVAARAGEGTRDAATLLLGHVLVLRADPTGGEAVLDNAAVVEQAASAFGRDRLLWALVLPLVWLEHHDRAARLLDRAVDEARALSLPSQLPHLLGFRSGLDFRRGRWASAEAGAGESVRLAVETGQESESAHGRVCLARLHAALGREAECRHEAARAVDLAERFGIESVRLSAMAATGHLDLALGRLDEAADTLAQVAAGMRRLGILEPAVLPYEADLIEAFARARRTDEAEAALTSLEARAVLSAPEAAASRCRGLLDGDAGALEHALELHAATPHPFELARTELAYGEHLRRVRDITQARMRLTAALETFVRLGAEPWTRRARAELAAAGMHVASPPERLGALTSQELQVVLRVAEGATNREVGAALFLSHKTVETHLGRAYRKLGVRSRSELVRLIAARDLSTPQPSM